MIIDRKNTALEYINYIKLLKEKTDLTDDEIVLVDFNSDDFIIQFKGKNKFFGRKNLQNESISYTKEMTISELLNTLENKK